MYVYGGKNIIRGAMSGLGIVQTQSLVLPNGTLHSTAPLYGRKCHGDARLRAVQPGSPVPFLVPSAYAIPPTTHGGYDNYFDDKLAAVHSALTAKTETPQVLMARSSALNEKPGLNPTLMVTHDPADRVGSVVRFVNAVRTVAGSSPDMGVLATAMVGGITVLPRNQVVFGYTNVSFVADTHNPTNPDEVYIALVNGLGTRVVEAGRDAIIITARRDNGLITHVGNRTTQSAIEASQAGVHPTHYRQRRIDSFDLLRGSIRTGRFGYTRYRDRLTQQGCGPSRQLGWKDGLLQEGAYSAWGDVTLRNNRPSGTMLLGAMPIADPALIHNLTTLLRYLARTVGPVQIEGAFPTPADPIPLVYQLIDVPLSPLIDAPFTIAAPDFSSTDVIGVGAFSGPLIVYKGDVQHTEKLKQCDRRFAKTGYILHAKSHNDSEIDASPHCRWRLSGMMENLSSHPVTYMRLQIAEAPAKGYGLALGVRGNPSRDPDEQHADGDIRVFLGATLESNGRAMRMTV